MMSAGSAVTGNSRTSLAVPEREYFDNFAFDQVLRHGDLDSRTRLMVQLAALIASQAPREYRVMLGAALTAGVTPTEVKEIVCQAVPYVGMGKVFDVPARGQRGAANRRVKGHVSANLNVGNDRGPMLAVITQLLPFIGYPRTLNAIRVLDEITLPEE